MHFGRWMETMGAGLLVLTDAEMPGLLRKRTALPSVLELANGGPSDPDLNHRHVLLAR